LLYNHFHGTITNRKELLMQRDEVDTSIFKIQEALKVDEERFKELKRLQTKRKSLSQELNSMDKELVKQPELFQDGDPS